MDNELERILKRKTGVRIAGTNPKFALGTKENYGGEGKLTQDKRSDS
jgi:hypothetical protein